jgi:hypothetical protein
MENLKSGVVKMCGRMSDGVVRVRVASGDVRRAGGR